MLGQHSSETNTQSRWGRGRPPPAPLPEPHPACRLVQREPLRPRLVLTTQEQGGRGQTREPPPPPRTPLRKLLLPRPKPLGDSRPVPGPISRAGGVPACQVNALTTFLPSVSSAAPLGKGTQHVPSPGCHQQCPHVAGTPAGDTEPEVCRPGTHRGLALGSTGAAGLHTGRPPRVCWCHVADLVTLTATAVCSLIFLVSGVPVGLCPGGPAGLPSVNRLHAHVPLHCLCGPGLCSPPRAWRLPSRVFRGRRKFSLTGENSSVTSLMASAGLLDSEEASAPPQDHKDILLQFKNYHFTRSSLYPEFLELI